VTVLEVRLDKWTCDGSAVRQAGMMACLVFGGGLW
jgi:hypothetical protein